MASVKERVAKNEVMIIELQKDIKIALDIFNEKLTDVVKHSNEDITMLATKLDKQQQQIEAILKECFSRKLSYTRESAESKMLKKVLYFVAGGVVLGIITFGFDVIRSLFGI